MSNKVGLKGQVVIEKAIREKLVVKLGWQALQLLVDDQKVLYLKENDETTFCSE